MSEKGQTAQDYAWQALVSNCYTGTEEWRTRLRELIKKEDEDA